MIRSSCKLFGLLVVQVAFLSSRIERCEAKKLEWIEHELLDRNTQTIAIDPTDGKSKAFVEVH